MDRRPDAPSPAAPAPGAAAIGKRALVGASPADVSTPTGILLASLPWLPPEVALDALPAAEALRGL